MSEYTPTTDEVRKAWVAAEFVERDRWLAVHEVEIGVEFDRWLAEHDEGQQIKGIRRLLDYRPLPRDVRLYIEGYLEACAEESASNDVRREALEQHTRDGQALGTFYPESGKGS